MSLYYSAKPKKPYSVKNSNVNIQQMPIEKDGYYVGSASNMARLVIMVAFLFSLLFIAGGFFVGKELGELNVRITELENGK